MSGKPKTMEVYEITFPDQEGWNGSFLCVTTDDVGAFVASAVLTQKYFTLNPIDTISIKVVRKFVPRDEVKYAQENPFNYSQHGYVVRSGK